MNKSDEANESNVDVASKTPRDDLKCTPCREAKKKCIPSVDGDGRCQRCIKLKRKCSELSRVLDAPTVTLLTRELTTLLLSSCRISCRSIYSVIHPYPETRQFETGFTPLGSRSRTLSDQALEFLAVRLANLQEAFAEIIEHLNGGNPDLLEICLSAPRSSRELHGAPLIDILNETTATLKTARSCMYSRFLWLDTQAITAKPLQSYEAAAMSLRELFKFVDKGLSTQWKCSGIDIERGFPACHVALLSGNRSAALQLWQTDPNATDLLGRSMGILAAEGNDLDFLKGMNAFSASNSESAGCRHSMSTQDHRGLSALAIATTLGFEASFRYILSCQPEVPVGNDMDWCMIDLAFASGSRPISQSLLQDGRNLVPERLPVYFQEAIELGRADLVACLVQRLLHQFRKETPEMSELISLAERSVSQMRVSQRHAFADCQLGRYCAYCPDIRILLEKRIYEMETLSRCLRAHDHRILASQAAADDLQKIDIRTVYSERHDI